MTADTVDPTVLIGVPGIHDRIPEQEYHAHTGSLSVSGAKTLLDKTPAHFKWDRDHGRASKPAFNLGHAAHTVILGRGAELALVDANDWRTKAAQEQRSLAYATGKTPLLRDEYEQVLGMAKAIRANPLAAALFDPDHGRPEQSGYWIDKPTSITRRFRVDWLPESNGARLLVPDLKTTVDASPRAISKTMANFSYGSQASWYEEGLRALGVAESPVFLFVFVEKVPPYVVTVAQPSAEVLAWGQRRNRRAIELYKRCIDTDTWPGYSDDVVHIDLPRWAANDEAA